MQIDRHSLLPTPGELVLAATVGAVAGTVSAGLRWLIFRVEATRRTKRLQDTLQQAGKSFGDAVEQATKGLQQMARTGQAGPLVANAEGGVQDALHINAPFPTMEPADLEQIFADLRKARGEGGA